MELFKKGLRLILLVAFVMIIMTFAAYAGTGVIQANGGLNLRSGAGTEYGVICTIPNGTYVTTGDVQNGWVSVQYNGLSGYASGLYIADRTAEVNRGASTDARLTVGEQIIEYGRKFIGTPYVYGGSSPSGFDCSGFTSYVYRQFGYNINRTSYDQMKQGIPVDKANLRAGDIVVFLNGSHVGLYIGDGNFIHAKSPGKPLGIDSLWSGYYANNYMCARRIIY